MVNMIAVSRGKNLSEDEINYYTCVT